VALLDHKGSMVTLGHKRWRTALVHEDSMGHMGQLRRVHKGPRSGRLHNRSKLVWAYMHWTAAPHHTAERIARRWWSICARWRRCISRAWGWWRRLGARCLPRAGTAGRNDSNNDGDDGTHGGFKEKAACDLGAISLNFPVYAETPWGPKYSP